MTDSGLQFLTALQGLVTLDVSDCSELTDLGVCSLAACAHLRVLDLVCTPPLAVDRRVALSC